ncbi:hypothetical protein CHUAL_000875 [Chamberlinius hualienensis]
MSLRSGGIGDRGMRRNDDDDNMMYPVKPVFCKEMPPGGGSGGRGISGSGSENDYRSQSYHYNYQQQARHSRPPITHQHSTSPRPSSPQYSSSSSGYRTTSHRHHQTPRPALATTTLPTTGNNVYGTVSANSSSVCTGVGGGGSVAGGQMDGPEKKRDFPVPPCPCGWTSGRLTVILLLLIFIMIIFMVAGILLYLKYIPYKSRPTIVEGKKSFILLHLFKLTYDNFAASLN